MGMGWRSAVILAGAGTAALLCAPAALGSAPPASSHGVKPVPLLSRSSDPLEIVPLIPPKATPPATDDLEIAPLIPKKPPPVIEIIRWKKKKVTRPKRPNFTVRQQTFNAYLTGVQSAILSSTIDVDAEPGLCNRSGSATVVYFASRRPVLASAAGKSISIPPLPVTINFASSLSYNPDIDSCFTLRPSSACRPDGQSLPGTATFGTRGNGTTTRSLYLERLQVDEATAGSACVDGLFGFPEILGIDSGSENAAIPWGAVGSRSQQNVSIGNSYRTEGNQSTPGTTCTSEVTGYACAFSSLTKWNLRLVRAPQKKIPGLR